ncbi:MAG: serine hydrolase [Robiginitalea sp.]|jgi:beta-lactamase class A|uniref:serine hydrolase n=1 Tax=Robiginitalea sp. TaxID=1902411 RepID=UPI003C722BEA
MSYKYLAVVLLGILVSGPGCNPKDKAHAVGESAAGHDSVRVGIENAFAQIPELPIKISDESFKPLKDFRNSDLQQALEAEIKSDPNLRKLISNRKLSIGLVDLTNWEIPAYASINGREMMYAASLPKIAVLLAAEDAIHKKQLEETESLKRDMHAMIRYSDNQATTRVIDLLGYEKIERVMRDAKNQFYQEDQGGGLWVGKRYSKSGKTNREPLKNLSHAANVYQVCRFYYRLAFGKLISYDRSRDMLDILEAPGIKHKFVHTLLKLAPEAQLYRKSGSWQSWHADSVLVWDEDRRYILVALIEDSAGERIAQGLVIPVERALNSFKSR